jgi:hypothetical protein
MNLPRQGDLWVKGRARQRYEREHGRAIEGLVIYLSWKDAAA